MAKTIHHDYTPYGACRELWSCRENEILLEGPAGTGKTRGLLEYVNYLCERWPGIRVLFLRQTRESLNESVLVTWEEEVLWRGHPCMVGSATRNHRQYYHYPNGSHIVLGGLDKAEKTFSTQYDVICVFEARETTLDSWQKLSRANRNFKMRWQQRIADTNPASEYHWLNQRANDGDIKRLVSVHKDNPVYFDHKKDEWTIRGKTYVHGTLSKLRGAVRANLYEGRWASEEGVVFEDYQPGTHIIDKDDVPELKWFFGSFDKGIRHPGCLQIWGVNDDRMYRIREIYRTQKNIDWWAEHAYRLWGEFDLQAIVCDPSEPDYINIFNDMIGDARGRGGERVARKATNAIAAGIGLCQWAFSTSDSGPRIFLVRGALEGSRDPDRYAARKPCCLEEELPSYIWTKSEDGKPVKEKPDPLCADHAVDAMRYAAMFMWNRDMEPDRRAPDFPEWSFGNVLGHTEILEESYEVDEAEKHWREVT